MASRLVAAVVVALVAASAPAAATASSRVKLPHLGVIKVGRTAHGARAAAVPKGYQATGGMTYHGGSVMHTNTTHAIYWQGSSSDPFPANYLNVVDGFLANVASDSGTRGNVYSTDIQYYDNESSIRYESTFAGGLLDTTPYPVVGSCAPVPVATQDPPLTFDKCVTEDQLANELDAFIAAHHLPRGLGDVYLLFLPPGVQTCSAVASPDCFGTTYCAYHSGFFENNSSAPVTLFANLPYAGDVDGCVADPSKEPHGKAEPTLDSTSHEQNETITDPLGDAWYDESAPPGQGENGDLCTKYYGPLSPSRNFNQVIGGEHYFIQSEWSNLDGGCALNLANHAPRPSLKVSTTRTKSLTKINFDGSGSGDPDGSVVSYRWRFGDGGSASGKTVSHTYKHPGTRVATLTVTDNDGLPTTAKVTIVITNRPPVAVIRLPADPVAGRAAKFRGGRSHDPDGSVVSYVWHFGDHTPSARGRSPKHTYRHGGSYRVKLTVTDDSGRRSSTRATVTVGRR